MGNGRGQFWIEPTLWRLVGSAIWQAAFVAIATLLFGVPPTHTPRRDLPLPSHIHSLATLLAGANPARPPRAAAGTFPPVSPALLGMALQSLVSIRAWACWTGLSIFQAPVFIAHWLLMVIAGTAPCHAGIGGKGAGPPPSALEAACSCSGTALGVPITAPLECEYAHTPPTPLLRAPPPTDSARAAPHHGVVCSHWRRRRRRCGPRQGGQLLHGHPHEARPDPRHARR